MATIINILKSRGKIGGVGLMIVGLGEIVLTAMGKIAIPYEQGVTVFLMGLAAFGIRAKLG